jgi:hypothetical protein
MFFAMFAVLAEQQTSLNLLVASGKIIHAFAFTAFHFRQFFL